jgi:Arc/MetJ family transcription regulator
MRTNVFIDDALLSEAMELSGQRTKRAVIEEALKLLVERGRRRRVAESFGKFEWEGELEQLRRWRHAEGR